MPNGTLVTGTKVPEGGKKMEVSASILSVKKENCIKTFYNLETSGIDYFHIDVMDGEFVENNTTSLMTEYTEYLNTITNLPLDVHLMVKDAMSYIKSYLIFEPRNITVHYESAKDENELKEWIEYIKDNNCKVGVSIKPNTDVEKIYNILPYVHTVLVMTVEPGKGGQKLIPETIEKIKTLKEYIDKNGLEVDIEADGGINESNVEKLKEAGCNIVVAGTSIIDSENFKETVEKLRGE